MVAAVRGSLAAPRRGDVLCGVNGAPLAALGLPVAPLLLALRALPRPLRLAFVPGTPCRAAGQLAGPRPVAFPEHGLKQVP